MLKEIQEALLKGRKDEVEKLVDQALAARIYPTAQILNEGLIAGMEWSRRPVQESRGLHSRGARGGAGDERGLAKLEPFLVRDGIQPEARSSSARSRAISTTLATTSWP